MKLRFWALFSLLVCGGAANAQKVSNVRAALDTASATVSILYDLAGVMEGQLFRVNVYSSHNQYITPLLQVTGAVGDGIVPGADKQIVWNPKELNNFDGQVSFDVRAVLTFSPFAIKTPIGKSRHVRGRRLTIAWRGGVASEKVRAELYRNGEKETQLALTPNRGEYHWRVPARYSPGSKYQVRISSETRPDNFQMSEAFSIRRRIPLVLKALPVALGAAGAYFLLNTDTPPPKTYALPEPGMPKVD